ncbi:MAG: hypothetical protein M1837_006484 [Sclerophora amabilis]|nr:MAG: hypothetical protein M1837_006484 [Sclerophora amabilis]
MPGAAAVCGQHGLSVAEGIKELRQTDSTDGRQHDLAVSDSIVKEITVAEDTSEPIGPTVTISIEAVKELKDSENKTELGVVTVIPSEVLRCNAYSLDSVRSDLVKGGVIDISGDDESPRARIERLGRQRPEKFKSGFAETGFLFSMFMSQILAEYFVSGFNVLLPTLLERFDIPSASATWPASAFSIVVSTFLLGFGRLADMYGGYPVFLFGLVWLMIWSVVAGFSQNEIMLDVCRAMQGLGPAASLPSAMMLMGSIYRPGPRKNLIFSIYGAAAPFGFFVGILFSGIAGQYLDWQWYFWIGAILTLVTTVAAYFSIPSDLEEHRKLGLKMDWLGLALIVAGLTLFIFAITQSSHAPYGWKTPYIIVFLLVGALVLAAATYVEGWVAEAPLLPFDTFRIPRLKAVMIVLFLVNGGLGMFLFYVPLYMQSVMKVSSMQVVVWFIPIVLGGFIIATIGGCVLHLLPGTLLIIIAGGAWVVSPCLFALAPVGSSFWAFTFPSMICFSIGIDLIFNITNIFITTNLPSHRQGLAGALINSVLHLGISFFLGFAEVILTQTARLGAKLSIQAVFWFQVGVAASAFLILIFFVKIEKASSDLTRDEKAELEAEGTEMLVSRNASIVPMKPGA